MHKRYTMANFSLFTTHNTFEPINSNNKNKNIKINNLDKNNLESGLQTRIDP